ncbi:SixA phosphatase family protein [Rubinisphaera margarita]|uniref:SixA phosphatase family protein n=1 Tax=Rubinisphaera margarita TaxID=2909586 RepID=UPI001EE982B4|nr:histidine phosphatase family protein [Rubinisphaera margarita]MCG6156020.1 histidine phosphatase family protein [Rubinisphaera margarita]
MALRLILMRHAKSSWDDGNLQDFDRPLNKRGRRDAPRMGRWVTAREIEVDRCLCSTATRTRETFDLWQQGSHQTPTVEYIEDLYHAPPGLILDCVKDVAGAGRTVMVIAHNPGMESLTAQFSGQDRRFPTAATAIFEFPQLERWRELTRHSDVKQLAFQVPKELPSEVE